MQKRRRSLKRTAAVFLSMTVAASLFAGTAGAVFAEETAESEAASVRVVVINNTNTSEDLNSALQGTFVDEWVEVESDSTALSVVTAALTENGYTLNSYDSSYGTYLTSVAITDSEADGDTLAEATEYYTEDDVNYMSGSYWSIWLNGQYCSYGIDYYSMADATLSDGDTFILDFTGYTYNSDTRESVGESLAGLVNVVVENTTDSTVALTGTITDKWVEVTSSSTALSALTDALAQDGYSLESHDSSYGTYLSGITSDAASLAGYDDTSVDGNTTYYIGAYWAIYLNDTYCDYGIDYYTVADSTLAAGDKFTMSYESYSYSYTTDDGTTDDGTTDDGTTDDGTTDDGTTDDGATDDGTTDDGTTDDGTSNDGTTDDGTTNDGTTNDDATNDGPTDGGSKTTLKAQKITVKKASLKKTYKASKLKKSKKTFKIKASAKTKVTFAKKNKKYIKVTKNGTVTVKKGTPKGTYKVKVKIKAAKTGTYKKASVTKTITVKVK